jgi:hypothetical protein
MALIEAALIQIGEPSGEWSKSMQSNAALPSAASSCERNAEVPAIWSSRLERGDARGEFRDRIDEGENQRP